MTWGILNITTRIYFARNGWKQALAEERELLQGTVLIVTTGRSLIKLGYLDSLKNEIAGLAANGKIIVFDNISANPQLREISEAVAIGKKHKVEMIIGFGGGSALDAAKAIAAGIGSDISLDDMLLEGTSPGADTLPIIAIPTTAGTGSELSRAAIISSDEHGIKGAIRGRHIVPVVAIVDSSFTDTLPRQVTMEAGFDALAHAVESWVSLKADAISKGISEQAIRLIAEHLPRLATRLDDIEAREAMMYSSMIVGINLAQVSTLLPHRMQYPVGIRTNTSHGAGLMALYPAWLDAQYEKSSVVLEKIATILNGEPTVGKENTLKAFGDFIDKLKVRKNIRQLGITVSAKELADSVRGDMSALDPIASQPNICEQIYQQSMDN